MKTVIMYRTALLAHEIGRKIQSSTAEFKDLRKLVADFNNGEYFSTSENDIDMYSIVKDNPCLGEN